MPELPEVETVRRTLEKQIIGKKITKIDIRYKRMIVGYAEEFKHILEGKTFTSIDRRGKYLIFHFNEGYAVISHLRMEGKYFYQEDSYEEDKHTHVIFYLDNHWKLLYQDVRKFGTMELKTEELLYKTKPLALLGKEPFECDGSYLYSYTKRKKIAIKSLLMDQTILLGLGNIYANEVLFASEILPMRPANEVTENECDTLISNSQKILKKAIKLNGTTIRSYTSSLGIEGSFQDFLQVHTKKVCPKCGKDLEKTMIGGRSAYYCLKCQR